jgi:hypothetical protein
MGDKNLQGVLAAAKAGARKDARLVAPTCLAVTMTAKAEARRAPAEAASARENNTADGQKDRQVCRLSRYPGSRLVIPSSQSLFKN